MSRVLNIRPLLALPLWGTAMTSMPSLRWPSRYRQRSSGSSESNAVYGIAGPLSAKITQRCRFWNCGAEVHSNPMNAVNFPGALYLSAMASYVSQVERSNLGSVNSGIGLLTTVEPMSFLKASPDTLGSVLVIIAYHGDFANGPLGSMVSRTTPRYSAWSVTARKSSGAMRFCGLPMYSTVSPMAYL